MAEQDHDPDAGTSEQTSPGGQRADDALTGRERDRERGQRGRRVGTALASRAAGWMVAAVLAGSIAGFWVGRATDSQGQAVRQVAVTRGAQVRALGVPAGPNGRVVVQVPAGAGVLPGPLAGLACARPAAPRSAAGTRVTQVPAPPVLIRPGARRNFVRVSAVPRARARAGRGQIVILRGNGTPRGVVALPGIFCQVPAAP